MSKYCEATEKQIDCLISFVEFYLHPRKFTSAELTKIRNVCYTLVGVSQVEIANIILDELQKGLNDEDNAPLIYQMTTRLKDYLSSKEEPENNTEEDELMNLSIQLSEELNED